MRYIRLIRRLSQAIFLAFAILVTLNLIESIGLISVFNYLHVVPSLSKLADLSISTYMLVFLLLILVNLIFGRLYCSFLCPVGLIQDISIAVSDKLGIKKRKVPGMASFKTFLLFLFLVLVFVRLPLYFLVDHFTNMVSFLAHAVNPLISMAVSPLSGAVYEYSSIYFREIPFDLHRSFFYSIFFILSVFISSLFFPRLFCNSICPSGLLFSFLARHSLLSIRQEDSCRTCGKCDRKCPVMCIEDGYVDKTQCIMCFECLRQCPVNSLRLSFKAGKGRQDEKASYSKEKRGLLRSALFAGLGLSGGFLLKSLAGAESKNTDIAEVFPPGGDTYESFLSRCTNCGLCISVCPTGVLKPVSYSHSSSNRLLPALDFNKSYCSFECNVCMSVCPMNALKYLSLPEKQVTAIGKARLDTGLCIPYSLGLDCGACAEHCPTAAIKMIDLGKVLAPVVSTKHCIGCGICQYSCPVEGTKAIAVKPLDIHEKAYIRPRGSQKKKLDDFPF